MFSSEIAVFVNKHGCTKLSFYRLQLLLLFYFRSMQFGRRASASPIPRLQRICPSWRPTLSALPASRLNMDPIQSLISPDGGYVQDAPNVLCRFCVAFYYLYIPLFLVRWRCWLRSLSAYWKNHRKMKIPRNPLTLKRTL